MTEEEWQPAVDRWIPENKILVPTLYGQKVTDMSFDDYGPMFVKLADGSEHESDDQGRTWRQSKTATPKRTAIDVDWLEGS